ncbi:hypothetical protein BH10PSE2_BH10PSE2_04250 [soil metagenome]
MKRIILAVAVASLAVGGLAVAQSRAPAHHETPEADEADESAELASAARITPAEAQAIALRARPGQVTDHELEREAGGSGLRYSFDIASGGKAFEVGVDAQSGAVLENKEEGPNPD